MAKPTNRRPADNQNTLGAKPVRRLATKNRTATAINIRRRPKRSASLPLKPAPKAAPPRTVLVTTLCIQGERLKSLLTNGSAPEMTPVS
jgi:hypothetical protein